MAAQCGGGFVPPEAAQDAEMAQALGALSMNEAGQHPAVVPVVVSFGHGHGSGELKVKIFELRDLSRGPCADDATGEAFRAHDSISTVCWPSAVAVANEIAGRAASMPFLKVLELGAGAGLCSLLAYKLGATVLATDVSPVALRVLQEGAKVCYTRGGRLDARLLDVFDERATAGVLDSFMPDLIVASDLLFDGDMARAVARVLLRACRGPAGAMALVADPGREARAEFIAELAEEPKFRRLRFEPRLTRLDGIRDPTGRHGAEGPASVDVLAILGQY